MGPLFLNCTLKPSPQESNTDRLASVAKRVLERMDAKLSRSTTATRSLLAPARALAASPSPGAAVVKVVITGATGNVGTSLLAALRTETAVEEIVGIARRPAGIDEPRVRFVTADVARDDLDPIFRGADAVVHLAWLIQPSRDERDHCTRSTSTAAARVFEAAAAAGVPALVHASSVGAYSPGPKDRAVDESWPTGGHPDLVLLAPQGASRAAARRLRSRAPGHADRAPAAGPDLQARGRDRDPAAVRRPAPPRRARCGRGSSRSCPTSTAPALPGRALARRRRGLPPRRRGRRRAGRSTSPPSPVIDPDELGRAARRAAACPVRGGVLRAAADLTWKLRLQPAPAGLDRPRPGRADHGRHASADRAGLDAAPQRGGRAAASCSSGCATAPATDTPPLASGTGGPARLRELLTGIGGR